MADDRARMLSLAKVLIAAAWADGEITLDEQNSLRDIIFHLSDSAVTLSAQEWALLEMYIESPIGADERTTLVAELQDAIRNKAERDFVLNALQQMAFADGVSGGEEQQVIQEITDAIEQADTGLLDGLNRLLGRTLSRRSAAVAGAPDRAVYFEDYLNNKVYYETSRVLREEGRTLDLSNAEMRKLGLAGGLMARIAKVDRSISKGEHEAMINTLVTHWALDREAAVFVVNVAESALDYTYDYYRMTREFATSTTLEERRAFLTTLFLIAAADDDVSFDETEEIRLVAQGINLSHEDFIEAKLRAKEAQS